ncbi:MAG: Branched-chain amino acid dehydrogenase [deaminating] [Ktedonobacterales bacterium]|jgi:leucine dehydrogenase|nr:MAG: Branched-chain amino acid dehydrogenase [deaminating] [Ktedonobacterales bacterium]
MTSHRFDDTHELLAIHHDPATDLHALIAIHSTRLGPAIGGTRLKWYPSLDAARHDVLRLSEGMTYKTALAGLSLGGGKAVIPYFSEAEGAEWAIPEIRAARLIAYAQIVDNLRGRFITAEDANITPGDLAIMKRSTMYVAGLPREEHGSGDPAPVTARGVVWAMKAITQDAFGSSSLDGLHVAVQGLGNVGMRLVPTLLAEGASVTAADVRPELAIAANRDFGIATVEPDALFETHCDVFAPCAYGAVLNSTTIPRLRCRAVVGSANNQLDEEAAGELLHARSILYGVDYVANAGGLINVAQELAPDGYDEAAALKKTENIYHTMQRVLTTARDRRISTTMAAQYMAREVLLAPVA